MQHRVGDWTSQIEYLRARINQLDHPIKQRDLSRLLATASALYVELDRELVNCRRQGRYTGEYLKLEEQLREQLRVVSKWLTWALLLA